MTRDFSFFFWGLILALVEIRIGGIDVLPAFVGYGLVAIGASGLSHFSWRFRFTRNFAWPLVALSLLVYAAPAAVLPPLQIGIGILTILLVWFLLGGVIQFTADRERPDLATHARNYRRVYVAIAIVAILFAQAALVQPAALAGYVPLTMLATLIILAFMLRLLYIVKHDVAVDSHSYV